MNTTVEFDVTTDNGSSQFGTLVPAARWCWGCVARYLPSRIADVISTFVPPFLVAFGTAGNLLTLAVLRSRHHKASPINVALAALSVADIGVLILGLLNHWTRTVWEVDIRNYHVASCKFLLALTQFLASLSPNLLAVTTVERCLSVCFPLQVAGMITKRRMIVTCATLAVLLFACHSPIIYIAELRPAALIYHRCAWSDPSFSAVWYWASFVIQFFIPFGIIAVGNSVIIARLVLAAARRRGDMQAAGGGHSKTASSVTVMLVAVGVAFLVTMTPYNVYLLGRGLALWDSRRSEHAFATHQLIVTVCYQLAYVNNAINFVLYCLGGSRFRTSVKVLCCGRKPATDANLTSLTNITQTTDPASIHEREEHK